MREPTSALAPVLGTAFWGWSLPPALCWALLDDFYARGHRQVDAATNYPINGIAADFRKAERILAEWIQAHGVQDLAVMVKVGSISNRRTPDNNLSKSFLFLCLDEYRSLLGPNLHTLMVHWDNREDAAAIADTCAALRVAQSDGLRVGLSGIQRPDLYALATTGLAPRIQVKHNLLHSDHGRYAAYHGTRQFIAYGINAGGLKLDPAAYHAGSSLALRGGNVQQAQPAAERLQALLLAENAKGLHPPITSFNECGLVFAALHPDFAAVILGVSTQAQLASSLNFLATLEQEAPYRELYQALCRFAGDA